VWGPSLTCAELEQMTLVEQQAIEYRALGLGRYVARVQLQWPGFWALLSSTSPVAT
jgi:hypothetical protein